MQPGDDSDYTNQFIEFLRQNSTEEEPEKKKKETKRRNLKAQIRRVYMKIALLNDTHFGCRNDSPAFMEYQNKFYDNIFFPYLIENNIKYLIHLGDVVDRRKFINHNTAHNFRKKF